jgi:hypothetical protein
MAQFTKVSGDFQPVMNYDAPGYTKGALNAVTSGASVQPQGPKLDFFTVEGANIDNASTESGNIALIVQAIQQLATVHMYQWTDAGANGTLAVAIYPTQAFSTDGSVGANLTAVCQAVVSSVITSNSATFTSTQA